MPAILLNLVAFQIGWWTTLLLAANGATTGAIAVGVVVAGLHALTTATNRRATLAVAAVALLGYSADSVLAATGQLVFPAHALPAWVAPLWILGLWLGFATTLDGCLRVLQRMPVLAAVSGAVSGPLAYGAGQMFGVVSLGSGWAFAVLAMGWAVVLPIAAEVMRRATQPNGPVPVAATQPALGAQQ